MYIATLFPKTCEQLNIKASNHDPCPVTTIRTWMEHLITDKVLRLKDVQFKEQFLELFPPDVPNVCDLPEDMLMNIKLKDKIKPMIACAYLCPKKY